MGRRHNSDKKNFTVGEIADLCSVSRHTVARWIDGGKLKGYRIPGRGRKGERRVDRGSLIAFVARHQIPHDAKSLTPESETDSLSEVTPEQLHAQVLQRAEAQREGTN